jgi:hypothetical protein
MVATAPRGLGAGGRKLWKGVTDAHELDEAQLAQLTEACRMKDRLDKLDKLLRGEEESWIRISAPSLEGVSVITVHGAFDKAAAGANVMKQLLAALRLPDEATGKRPQHRGARGSYKPPVSQGGAKVSALDQARQRATG